MSPRDYLDPPEAFGRVATARVRVPAGGDEVSAVIARVQHQLLVVWRQDGSKPSGAALGCRFGFSKQTWSRTALGERWMGETLMAALVDALPRHAAARRAATGSRDAVRAPRPGR